MNSTWQAVHVAAGETGIDVLNEVAKHGVVVVTGGNTVRPLALPFIQ
jgi:peptidase E